MQIACEVFDLIVNILEWRILFIFRAWSVRLLSKQTFGCRFRCICESKQRAPISTFAAKRRRRLRLTFRCIYKSIWRILCFPLEGRCIISLWTYWLHHCNRKERSKHISARSSLWQYDHITFEQTWPNMGQNYFRLHIRECHVFWI